MDKQGISPKKLSKWSIGIRKDAQYHSLFIKEMKIQKDNEVSPHTCQNGYYQKKKEISTGEDVEKWKSCMVLVGM